MRTKLFHLPMVLLLLTTLVSPMPAQAGPPSAGPGPAATPALQLVGQIGGNTNVAVYSGTYVFANIGPRIVRIPFSSLGVLASAPDLYGDPLPGIPQDMELANNLLYVALGTAGVAVVDPNTSNLAMVSSAAMPSGDFAAELAVGPARLYVADGSTGVVAFTIGVDKKTLALGETSAVDGGRNVTDLAVGPSSTLYVAVKDSSTTGGVYKYNITSPGPLGTHSAKSSEMGVNAIAVGASSVYAAGDTELTVLNSTNLATTSNTPASYSNSAVDIELRPDEQVAFLLVDLVDATNTMGIDVINISNPQAPQVSYVDLPTAGIGMGFAVAEFPGNSYTYLYVADGDQGLSVVTSSHSTPENVEMEIASLVQARPADTLQSAAGGGQAYAYSNLVSLWTINNSTPGTPLIVGAVITPSQSPKSLSAQPNALLLSALSDGLMKMPTTLGAEPGTPAGFAAPGIVDGDYAYESVMVGSYVMLADGFNGLAVVDPSNMQVLTRTQAYQAGVSVTDFRMIDASGNNVSVIDTMDNTTPPQAPVLRVFDVSTPSAPQELRSAAVSTFCGTGLLLDMHVSGNYGFLACGDTGIKVVDLTSLTAMPGYDTPGYAQSVFILGSNLYVADGDAGIEWLTIGAGGSLTPKGSAPVAGSALHVMATTQGNGHVYVSTGAGGLQVFQQAAAQYLLFVPFVTR